MKNIVSIIFLCLAVGIFFFYADDKYQEVKDLRVEVADYTEALRQSKDILLLRDNLSDQYKSFKKSDLDSLKKLLPDHIDNVQLVLDLNGIAKKYGLALKGVKVQEESIDKQAKIGPSKDDFGSILLSFKVSSTYDAFVKFLEDVEKSLRIVDVTALSFKANDKNIYEFSVTIKTYWLK